MLERRRTGSVVCPSCGRLVGAAEARCPFCGGTVRGVLGLEPVLRRVFGELGLWPLVMGACVVLYLAMLAVDPGGMRTSGGLFGILVPSSDAMLSFGASGAWPVFRLGRWWTLLSAGWLHGGVIHIFFNLMWMRQLAPLVQELYGPARAVIVYVLAGASGFFFSVASSQLPVLLQQLTRGGAPVTLGASASLFGLLAALIHYSRRGGVSALGQQVWTWAIALFVFGLIFPGVDNWAHLGGFAGGWLLSVWLDPLRPERPVHRFVALLCILASAGAVALSIVTAP